MATVRLGVTPLQAALALGGGLLGAAAFWPLSLWPLMLASIALFLWLLRDEDTRAARYLGLLYGLAFAGGTMHWMFHIWGAWAAPLLALMAAYFVLFAMLVASTRGLRPTARAALAALFAVAVEWLRGDAWALHFPWYTPAHALAASPPSIAAARWVGTYGISYVLWLIAAAGAFVGPRAWCAFFLLPACWLLLPGDGEPDRRALLVQTEEYEGVEKVIATIPKAKVDLAVLPELAYGRSPEYALARPNGPAALARKTSSPVVFGAVEGTYGVVPFSNVAAVIGTGGELLGTFPKQRPVPLMEDGAPGDRRPVFAVEGGVLGVAVCYDFDVPAVAGALVRDGATVLVAPTMDVMRWGRAQHEHHALLFRLRAVEADRWLVRASSSGRTEVVSPRGVPSSEGVEIGPPGWVVLPFAHRDTWAPGARLAFLGPLAALATVAYLAWRALARLPFRSRRASLGGNQAPQPVAPPTGLDEENRHVRPDRGDRRVHD
jgi:apolipoprotein N-acyltransferase